MRRCGDVVDALLRRRYAFRFTFVDVGNPHCVILVDDPARFDVADVGARDRASPLFPNRVNVEFIRVEADGSVADAGLGAGRGGDPGLRHRSHRRGGGPVRLGLATSPVMVHLLGGDLTIEVEASERMAARARRVRRACASS